MTKNQTAILNRFRRNSRKAHNPNVGVDDFLITTIGSYLITESGDRILLR